MRWETQIRTVAMMALLAYGASGCGSTTEDETSTGDTSETDDTCFDCNTTQASFLHLDSENIAALLSVDPDTVETVSSRLAFTTDGTEEIAPSPLQGIDGESGEIRDALRCFSEESGTAFDESGEEGLSSDCWDAIPRIVSVAECDGYIYLVFERSFIVRTETADGLLIEDYSDPWSASSPFTSQLLRSSVPIGEYQAGDRVEAANLEGVLYDLEINTWDRRRNIQFDDECNLYLTAHVPGTSDDVLISIAPDAGEDEYTEIINANICYERYLVTGGGDVHYTGDRKSVV